MLNDANAIHVAALCSLLLSTTVLSGMCFGVSHRRMEHMRPLAPQIVRPVDFIERAHSSNRASSGEPAAHRQDGIRSGLCRPPPIRPAALLAREDSLAHQGWPVMGTDSTCPR